MIDGFAILEPIDGFDRVSFVVTFEGGWTSIIDNLLLGFHFNRQGSCKLQQWVEEKHGFNISIFQTVFQTCDCQNCLDTLSTHGVVHHTKVFSGVVHFGLFDDKSSTNLFHAIIQIDQFLVVVAFHELVPSTIFNTIFFRHSLFSKGR